MAGNLGEVLAALHGATPRWQTLHARVRHWNHAQRRHEAFRAHAEERQGRRNSGFSSISVGSTDREPDPETTMLAELWLSGDNVRSEESGPGGERGLLVRRGELWWRYSSRNGAISNEREEDRHVSTGGLSETFGVLWEPWQVAGNLELEPAGETEVAGRGAWLVHARPRPDTDGRSAFDLHALGMGADEYELAVDRERGILLRVASRHGGLDFSVMEVEHVELDEPIADEVFVFEAPDGVVVRSLEEAHRPPRSAPLHEVAAAAEFEVWAPVGMAKGWMASAMLFGDEDGQVHLSYHRTDAGATSVNINEAPADRWGPIGYNPDDPDWATETHGGREMRVLRRSRRGMHPVEIVNLVLGGTRIELQARNLALDQVIELAASLEQAPTEPPPLF